MQVSDTVAAKIAEYLLQINAIKLQPDNPFTWASGWRSPIYNDNRVSLSHPEVRSFIKRELATLVRSNFNDAEVIVGVATAGIAPGALCADELGLPFGYVRSEPKKHGMGRQVEGDIRSGQKVVVIEDLVSTGKSSLHAVEVLRNENINVVGMASIFTYGFEEALNAFQKADCKYVSLCDYHVLLNVALQKGIIDQSQSELLAAWRRDPANWGRAEK